MSGASYRGSKRCVVLEIRHYESEEPPWAEWEMWREESSEGLSIQFPVRSEWIGNGTAPSLEGAIDSAADVWIDWKADHE